MLLGFGLIVGALPAEANQQCINQLKDMAVRAKLEHDMDDYNFIVFSAERKRLETIHATAVKCLTAAYQKTVRITKNGQPGTGFATQTGSAIAFCELPDLDRMGRGPRANDFAVWVSCR